MRIDLCLRDFEQPGLPRCTIKVFSAAEQPLGGLVDMVIRYEDSIDCLAEDEPEHPLTDAVWAQILSMAENAGYVLPSLEARKKSKRFEICYYLDYTKVLSCPIFLTSAYEALASHEITPMLVRQVWQQVIANFYLTGLNVNQRILGNPMLPLLLLEDPGLVEIINHIQGDVSPA